MKLGSVGASAIVRMRDREYGGDLGDEAVYLLMSEISYVDVDGSQGDVEAALQDRIGGFRETRA